MGYDLIEDCFQTFIAQTDKNLRPVQLGAGGQYFSIPSDRPFAHLSDH